MGIAAKLAGTFRVFLPKSGIGRRGRGTMATGRIPFERPIDYAELEAIWWSWVVANRSECDGLIIKQDSSRVS